MEYFNNLKNKWGLTEQEKEEIEKLEGVVESADNDLYWGTQRELNELPLDDVKKANQAERRINEIWQGVWKRRKDAILSK